MSKNLSVLLMLLAVAVCIPSVVSALSPDPRPIDGQPTAGVVPEPSAAALFGLGAALVAARSRKRR
jgi:hypothetical protein